MTNRDLTMGTPWKVILRFALPIMGSLLLQTGYTLADSIIVGNFVTSSALGAIGVTASTVWLINLVAASLGTGISIAMSQYVGAKRTEHIGRLFSTALCFAVLCGIGLFAVCLVAAKPLISGFLATPDSMHSDAMTYFRIIAAGLAFQMVYNVTYGALRAYGDSRGAILFLLVAAVVNVGLDCLFVIVFKMGVAGAAIATILAQAGCALSAFIYMRAYHPSLRISPSELRISKDDLQIILRISLPVMLQSGVTATGFIILQRLVNSFGEPSIEGFIAMQRVESLIHIPSNAFNTSISAYAGQNMGAGETERIKTGYKQTLFMSCSICLVLAVIAITFGRQALGAFNIQGDSLQRAYEHLQIVSLFIVFSTINNVSSGLLQGTGDVRVPAAASFINLFIRLVSAYIMAETSINYRSIYYSLPLAWVTACCITALRYRRGKWQYKGIVK